MNNKLKVELNSQGVQELLKSAEMKALCQSHAEKIKSNCGSGYEVETITAQTRVFSSVKAMSRSAKKDNMKNNTILKALK